MISETCQSGYAVTLMSNFGEPDRIIQVGICSIALKRHVADAPMPVLYLPQSICILQLMEDSIHQLQTPPLQVETFEETLWFHKTGEAW